MLQKLLLTFLLLTATCRLQPPLTHAQTTNDVTSRIENLGNPFKTRWPDTNTSCRYARNVWDMKNFNNKIYLGTGNSSNVSPCINGGPVDITSYSTATSAFTNESTISQEQIDRFVVLNNALVIPGHDPKGSDSLYWYRLENNAWVQHIGVNTGQVVHTFDMTNFNNAWFAAVGPANASSVQISTDNGTNWVSSNLPIINRSYTLFQLNNKLYSTLSFPITPVFNFFPLYEYTSGTNFTGFSAVQFQQMFPTITSSPESIVGKLIRTENYLNQIVYIGGWSINDQQGNPFGLFKANSISTSGINATKINLPGNAKPWDILTGPDGKLYILGSIQNGSGYWITVSSSTDLTNWTEDFRFDSPTFARSFEQLNGDFYFGLGTDTTALSTATGDILRYKTTTPTPSPSPMASTKPGNTDGDLDVDIFDHNTLLFNIGKSGSAAQGDTNNTGTIEIFDYNNLLGNFGK